jgi:hypothetical protein
MRWQTTKLHAGQRRTITRFLLIPRMLPNKDGMPERRWLERAAISQEVENVLVDFETSYCSPRWVDKAWAD